MNFLRCLAALLPFLFVASTSMAQSNSTVTFSKKGATDITSEAKVVLTVTKGANEVDKTEGAHKFPKYTSLKSVAAYYGPILTQNGLTEGTDFTISENSIHFYGVDKVDGGSSGGLDVEGTMDKGKFEPIRNVMLSMTRGSSPMFGVVTIMAATAFPGTPSTYTNDAVDLAEAASRVPAATAISISRVTVYYEAEDTAETMMAKIAGALRADGWSASADGASVVIESHRGGSPLHSISVRFQHLPKPGEGAPSSMADGEDHWVLERVVD